MQLSVELTGTVSDVYEVGLLVGGSAPLSKLCHTHCYVHTVLMFLSEHLPNSGEPGRF